MASGNGFRAFRIPTNKEELFKSIAKAKEWFHERLRRLIRGQKDPETEIMNVSTYRGMKGAVQNPFGRLSYFIYTAEYDKKLPYWDKTPLTIMYNEDAEHMYGLNLHYVHPKIRALILQSLLDNLTSANKPEAYFEISYSIIKGLSTSKYIKPCLKTYIKKNMNSAPVVLKPEAWQNAIMLPTATWQRSSDRKVWNDSARMYR